jgi:iron complex transport system permease protein
MGLPRRRHDVPLAVSKRGLWTILAFGGLLLVAAGLRMAIGPDGLELPRGGLEWQLRGWRVLSGAAAGASLAVGGVMLQSLLRNPLASPDLIGPAAGAGLAVSVAAYLGMLARVGTGATGDLPGWGLLADAPAALVGALGALAIVYLLSQRRGLVDPVSLVLVGVIVSIICGAGTLFVAHLMPPQMRFELARWTVGSLSDEVGGRTLLLVGLLAATGTLLAAWLGPAMDVASMSEDEARSAGVAIGPLRLTLFAASGVLTAGAVLLAGPVGFVGLVAPHAVRLIGGPGHRPLAIAAAMGGAALVILADAGVRIVDLGAGRMPLGVLTALVGGPVFLLLLRRGAAGRTQP